MCVVLYQPTYIRVCDIACNNIPFASVYSYFTLIEIKN